MEKNKRNKIILSNCDSGIFIQLNYNVERVSNYNNSHNQPTLKKTKTD